MIKIIFIIFASALLSACDRASYPVPDQCIRQELFEKCMTLLPKGPEVTKYNDWSEVVSECERQAYYTSLRAETQIPNQCRHRE